MRYLYTIILLSITSLFLNAQELLPYQFSVEEFEYNDLENPISLTNGQLWDDPNFTVPLGFDFEYLGQTVRTLSSNENLTGAMLLAGIGSSNGINMIIPYFSDLRDRGALTNKSISEINYEIVGDSPNKIAKIEWKNAGFYDEIEEFFESTSFVNLQVWVYEGTNTIEIRFGPNDINTKVAHEYGGASLGLVNNADFNSQRAEIVWNLFGNPFHPDVSEIKDISINDDPPIFIADPKDGMAYRFVPNVVSKTVQVESLDEVKIYPTLIQDQFFVENKSKDQIEVQVFNAYGSLLSNHSVQAGTHRIDTNAFGPGIYVVKMQQKDLVTSLKVVKQ